MMFPLGESGIWSGLLIGLLFGFVLESAGFGSSCKLTAQFSFRDWSVYKVMFTAIVVAATGLILLRGAGLLAADSVYVPTLYLWATLGGGALIGAGFALGGYCPGTSVVGLFSGRIDALLFIVGLLAGTVVFAGLFPMLEPLQAASAGVEEQTLPQWFGVPEWLVLAGLALVGVAVFLGGGRMEQSHGGAVSAAEVTPRADAASRKS